MVFLWLLLLLLEMFDFFLIIMAALFSSASFTESLAFPPLRCALAPPSTSPPPPPTPQTRIERLRLAELDGNKSRASFRARKRLQVRNAAFPEFLEAPRRQRLLHANKTPIQPYYLDAETLSADAKYESLRLKRHALSVDMAVARTKGKADGSGDDQAAFSVYLADLDQLLVRKRAAARVKLLTGRWRAKHCAAA